VTYRRDFLVSDQLDSVVGFIIGAEFMLEQWSVLFGKMKKIIAVWFKHKKETPGIYIPVESQHHLDSTLFSSNPNVSTLL
jgi:hypothetical protein